MGLGTWILNFFTKTKISEEKNSYTMTEAIDKNNIMIEAFALFATIETIATLLSKIEFKTYENGKPYKGYEWYSLNVRPNKNQNATEFWQEAICKLLYDQEVLIFPIAEQKIIADYFSKDEKAVTETIFTQISRGDFNCRQTFNISEVIYLKYSNENVRSLIHNVFDMYNNLISEAADKYERAGGQKGTLEISAQASGDKDFENRYKDLMNNRFKSFFNSKNAVMPLYTGYKYTAQGADSVKKSTSEISDIKNLFDEAMSRAAQAYKMPPALVRGEVAGLEQAFDIMLTYLDPIANMISEEFTGKLYTVDEVIDGSYIKADTTCIKHVDIFDIAGNADKLISSGIACIDEVRERVGLYELFSELSQKHWITKNYESIENLGGGDNQ